MKKYASRFQLALNVGSGNYYLVDWGDGRTGLYIGRGAYKNDFKTGLAAVGTREEMEALVKEHGPK